MKMLQELNDIILIRENHEHLFDRFDKVKDKMSVKDGDRWDELMDAFEMNEEHGDEERADAYAAQLEDLLAKYETKEHMKECFDCELVYVDENNNIIEEAATVAYRRKGKNIVKKFRCMAGEKKGRLVANPKTCITRKNPKRMIVGKRVARSRKGLRLRKSAIARKTNASKMVRKMNKRLKHHGVNAPGHM